VNIENKPLDRQKQISGS